MRKFKLIGLTGQTGAGKSLVAEHFKKSGYTVIDADAIVKKLYESGSVCIKTLSAVFGSDILSSDGALNRALLAERAFKDKESTALLGAIVHPFVTAVILKALKREDIKNSSVVIYDAPQLFESNFDAVCDFTISVTADKNVRLNRICLRDKIDEKSAELRINAQLDEDFFRQHSDFVIENNSEAETLYKKAEDALKTALSRGEQ